jgi:hypothetical protein
VGVNRRGPAESVLENGEHWENCGFFGESNEYSASAARTLADMNRDSDRKLALTAKSWSRCSLSGSTTKSILCILAATYAKTSKL